MGQNHYLCRRTEIGKKRSMITIIEEIKILLWSNRRRLCHLINLDSPWSRVMDARRKTRTTTNESITQINYACAYHKSLIRQWYEPGLQCWPSIGLGSTKQCAQQTRSADYLNILCKQDYQSMNLFFFDDNHIPRIHWAQTVPECFNKHEAWFSCLDYLL